MGYLPMVLKTREAKEALGEGLLTLFETGKLDDSINAMISKGKKNGSWAAAKIAFILDLFGFK